jgi:hypothetical protein
VFAIPAVLIIFHEYLNLFFAVFFFVACFVLFGYYTYQEFLPKVRRAQLEEEEIQHRFSGDPEKMRFYRGFKRYFDGRLSSEGLKQWFKNHPRKH